MMVLNNCLTKIPETCMFFPIQSFSDKCQNVQWYIGQVLAVRALWVKWGVDLCTLVLTPSLTSVSPSVVENVPLGYFFLC